MTDITIAPPRLEVVSAIIIRGSRLLLQQRHPLRDYPMSWETPGGKIEAGESSDAALKRELREELGVDSFIGDFFNMAEFAIPLPLRIRFYRVDIGGQEPRCLDAMGLGWFNRAAVLSLDMTPGTAKIRGELAALLAVGAAQ